MLYWHLPLSASNWNGNLKLDRMWTGITLVKLKSRLYIAYIAEAKKNTQRTINHVYESDLFN